MMTRQSGSGQSDLVGTNASLLHDHALLQSHKPSRILLPGTRLNCLCGLWLCLGSFKQERELLDTGCVHAFNNRSWLMTNYPFAWSRVFAGVCTILDDGPRITPSAEPDRDSPPQVSQLSSYSLGWPTKTSPVLPHWYLLSRIDFMRRGMMIDSEWYYRGS